MSDTDKGFIKLLENLTTEQQVEFFLTMNRNQISTEADTVLSKFFLTLQVYVALYEKIPESIRGATISFQTALQKATGDFQKPVDVITQLKTEIEKLTSQAKLSAVKAETSCSRVSEELAHIDESLEIINSSVKEGVEKAAATVSARMTELLSAALEKAMPLADLKEAGEIFSKAIKEGLHASAELRENVKSVRRARFRVVAAWGAVAAIFIILGTAGFFYSWSERRIEQVRVSYSRYVSEILNNNDIVSELEKSGRRLILQKEADGTKLLVMENAAGQTNKKNGIIKFK